MNKFQKIILLFCLFSYIFSMKVTKIEPSTVTLGEIVEFTLTVQDYDTSKDYYFYLSNVVDYSEIFLSCSSSSETSTTLKCNANIKLYEKEDLNNLTKILISNDEITNLTVKIEKPKTLKLLHFSDEQYFYSYGVSVISFEVNYNGIYKSDFPIKFGDYSITNCSLYSIEYINCYYEFPESSAGQTLKLNFGGEDTEYSVNIIAPEEYSTIDYLNIKNYYVSSTEQDVYFDVDSSL